ncbi:putative two-component response regulator SSK1p [Xylogone sp. PMI_703]|nr:putative two-component response regulator SSK1p [Xylogone sp. PMI_703]
MSTTTTASTTSNILESSVEDCRQGSPSTTVDFPTPNTDIPPVAEEYEKENNDQPGDNQLNRHTQDTITELAPNKRPSEFERRQSLIPRQQTRLIKTLLETNTAADAQTPNLEYFTNHLERTSNMVERKIWVKRPGASATLVVVHEDDLVDDVRDTILRKYANSLGRNFDAPDVTIRIVPRENNRQERTLGPEEQMCRALDAYYPGGQTIDEALIIDVPLRRTPRPSPGHAASYHEGRPVETASDYFPPMPPAAMPSPRLTNSMPATANGQAHAAPLQHSMSVLTTGHVPPLPSPGSTRRHHRDSTDQRHRGERPRVGRQHTASPTVLTTHSPIPPSATNPQLHPTMQRTHSGTPDPAAVPSGPPPMPTPPLADGTQIQRVATPPPRVSSPRPNNRVKRSKPKTAVDHPTLPAGSLLNGAVPPINVLIVEDNIINLKLLEAFMKRLKVRWQTAMNGREAVTKWRSGGFHLVLMDIQLPIMSGLEATKEIRRLERLNHIGVFTSSASSTAPEEDMSDSTLSEDDILPTPVLFKSPVIIVALTASSLQSDRHEALAAGCNDFLTKPVNFVWLERKVMEWGCMQALIDFDGWRKWKDYSQSTEKDEAEKKKTATATKKKKRTSMNSTPTTTTRSIREEAEDVLNPEGIMA